ncbi:p21-C-terminal region-binding protein-domain-containing protein [Xylogone sp. PMI_703]|nr:p21-C-terminal region-binding protein-domain-containing protein [Xylogone sp. PMI_703]
MVRKRLRDPEVLPEAPASKDDSDDSGSDEDMDIVNVDFEWFNFDSEIDFHGVKSLLRQLLDVDAQLFDISALTDLIISQNSIGSTVKVDGKETDPYAFLTVLNLHEHREKKPIKDFTDYILQKSKATPALASVSNVLSSPSSQVGVVFAERLINVPAEIAPPMYTMLIEEIQDAVEDKEPYEFTHYLIISKVYHEVASVLDQEDNPRQKKSKAGKVEKETFYFHPEDEVLQRHALAYGAYPYTKEEGDNMADSKRAFQEMGIKPQGSMILIESSKFEGAAQAIGEYLNPGQ